MSSITFDTLKYAERLEQAGISREQAKAFAEMQKDSLSEVMDAQLATKSDISHLGNELTQLDKRLAVVETELTSIKWMVGSVGMGVLLLVIKTFLSN